MEHVLWVLMLFMQPSGATGEPSGIRVEVLDTFIQEKECSAAGDQQWARIKHAPISAQVQLQCVPVPHNRVW